MVQPDLLFISNERIAILRNQVWGAPDLVVEVESPGTRRPFHGQRPLQSAVLPELRIPAAAFFE